ncbi:MAG: hypothetical protein SGPRY_006533 [Prymnesium sp.]
MQAPLFRDFTAAASSRGSPSSSPLDQLHRPLLGAYAGELFPTRQLTSSVSRGTYPRTLVGIINGNEERRRLLSCTWLQLVRGMPSLRVLFVLGNASMPHRWSTPDASTLLVRCGERMYMHKGRKGKKPSAFTGTFTMYYKVVEFLLFAATQPEDFAVRVDDDAFVSPHMLLSYSSFLHQLGPDVKIYAGTFEWSSWRLKSMQATAFGYGIAEARGRARFAWRQCVTSVARVVSSDNASRPGACIGPIAFAKGPFMLLNKNALRWLASSPLVAADIRRASELQQSASRVGRIDDDMQVAYALPWCIRHAAACVPTLRVSYVLHNASMLL